jgi:hypothetical protein
MDLRERGRGDVDWIHLAHDGDQWWAVVNMIMNLWVPQKAGNFLTSLVSIIFSRRNLMHVVG